MDFFTSIIVGVLVVPVDADELLDFRGSLEEQTIDKHGPFI